MTSWDVMNTGVNEINAVQAALNKMVMIRIEHLPLVDL